jgi:DNA-binding NarL/FixJ family response regulator
MKLYLFFSKYTPLFHVVMTTIGIIDDDPNFTDDFCDFINTLKDVKCAIRAIDSNRFYRYFRYEPDTKIDIMFVDIKLGIESGLDLIPKIRRKIPEAEIIVYTTDEHQDTLLKAFCLGATGYLLKDTSFSELPYFINIIKAGGSVISPRMAKKLIGYFAPPKPDAESLFNERELQILKLLAEGWEYKQVADKVGLSVDGVRFYVKRIYKALNVRSKNELMKLASNKQLPI